MERLIFGRDAKEGAVNLWFFNWSLIIDLWIKGFVITIFNLLYELNSTVTILLNFPEYLRIFTKLPRCLAFSRDVSEGKSLQNHFLYIADLVYDSSKIDILSLSKGVCVWRWKRSWNKSGKWAQERDDHGLLINYYMIISKMFEYQITTTAQYFGELL